MYNRVEMIFEEIKQVIIRWLKTCDVYVRYGSFYQLWDIWNKDYSSDSKYCFA